MFGISRVREETRDTRGKTVPNTSLRFYRFGATEFAYLCDEPPQKPHHIV
jgi:hypothetical protein